jgi:anti-sigma factor RsiW
MADPGSMRNEDWEDLVAYLDGELDAKAARSMETKLNTDPTVHSAAQALRRTWELLDYLPRPEPSPAFTSKTLDRVSALRSMPSAAGDGWHPWIMGVTWVISVFVAAMIGYAAVTLARPHRPPATAPQDPPDVNERLVQDLNVIENKRLYEVADDIAFLRALDDPDLFGDEK